MNLYKYREIYLNDFTMKKLEHLNQGFIITGEPNEISGVGRIPGNHPWVNRRIAFWIGGQELCIGWILKDNPNIYRPIFSYKRNDLINKINRDIVLGTNVDKIWKKAKSRFFEQLCLIKKFQYLLLCKLSNLLINKKISLNIILILLVNK